VCDPAAGPESFFQARDAQTWIKKRKERQLTKSGMRQLLGRMGGKLEVPLNSHAFKDSAKVAAFKAELPARLISRDGKTDY